MQVKREERRGEEEKQKGYGRWRGGWAKEEEGGEGEKKKKRKKTCPFLAALKHQQALTTAAGVFLGPDTALRHLLLDASPSPPF